MAVDRIRGPLRQGTHVKIPSRFPPRFPSRFEAFAGPFGPAIARDH